MFNFKEILEELKDEHKEKKVIVSQSTRHDDHKSFDIPIEPSAPAQDKKDNPLARLLSKKGTTKDKEKDVKKKTTASL